MDYTLQIALYIIHLLPWNDTLDDIFTSIGRLRHILHDLILHPMSLIADYEEKVQPTLTLLSSKDN